MTAFSASWLALRETADLAARASQLLDRLERRFAGRPHCHVCDIGAGTGASVFAFAKRLPARQHWTLIDHDAALLRTAHNRLAACGRAGSTAASPACDTVDLLLDGRRLTIDFMTRDLAAVDRLWPQPVDLITASALLDLTSDYWIDALAQAAAEQGACVLATLTFDGDVLFTPHHPDDGAVRTAFAAHQKGEKGFGPAAGAAAAGILARSLEKRGYAVATAASPWRLGEDDRDLIGAFISGMASAVAETATLPPSRLDAWRRHRAGSVTALRVGHVDVFATPPL